jgi:hypothetical protein
MAKFGWTAVVAVGCLLAADRYWNYGFYTDTTLSVLRQISRSLRW